MAENTTQFMTSVMQKLRTANQVSQSNNLSTIVTNQQADNKPKPKQANPNGSYQVENHKTLSGKATTNNHSDYKFWDDLLSVNGGQGFIQDETVRNIVKGILTPFGTIEDVANEVAYGVTKVGESLVDGLVGLFGWIGSWFGADDQWAKDFIAYDASRWCVENLNLNLMDGFSQLALGESLAEQSVINELPEGWQDGIRGASNIVGEIIPSVVLAIFTGGSSLGVQVAAQAALAGVSAYGQSVESGVQSGAELGESIGYGAIKGGVSAVLAGVTHGVGGAITSKTGSSVGGKIMDKVIDKGGSMTTALVAQAGFKVTTSAGRAALQTAVDPLIRQITIDGEAIEKAYGSEEAVKNTLGNIGKNAAMAAIITLGTTAVQTGVEVHKAGGMEQYTQNYLDAKVFRDAGLGKEYNNVKAYTKNIEKLDSQLQNGEITKEQWLDATTKLNNAFESDINKLQDVYREVGEKGISAKDYSTSRYAEQYSKAMESGQKLYDLSVDRQRVPAFIKIAREQGHSDTEIFNKLVRENVIKGSVDITNEKGETTFTTKDNLKLTFKSGDDSVNPANSREVTALIGVIDHITTTNNVPNVIALPSSFSPKIGGNETTYQIDFKTVQNIVHKQDLTPKQLTTILKTLPRANVVSDIKDGSFKLVSQTFNNEGQAQYNVFQIQDNSIKSMTIADKVPEDVYSISLEDLENEEYTPIGTPGHIVESAADMTLEQKNSLNSSTNVVKRFKNDAKTVIQGALKDVLGDKKVSFKLPSNKKLGRYLFEKVNDPKVASKAASEISTALTDFSFSDDKGNSISFEDLLALKGQSIEEYRTQLTRDIQNALNSTSKETKISKIGRVFEKNMNTIKTLVEKNRESIKAGGAMRVFTNTRNNVREVARMDLKWDGDTAKYNTLGLMLKPITNIHSRGNVMSTRGFWENIEEWKANYTQENALLQDSRLPYSETFREEMLILEELMPKQNENGTYPAMNSLALAQATRVMRMAQGLLEVAKTKELKLNPQGRAVIKEGIKTLETRSSGKVATVIRDVNNFFAGELENDYTYFHTAFGNNPVINRYVSDLSDAYHDGEAYYLERIKSLSGYAKAHKVDKVIGKKQTLPNTKTKISNGQLGYLYALKETPEDWEELTRVNKLYIGEEDILSKMSIKELENFIDTKTPDNVKDFSLHIKWLLNNQEKPIYSKWYVTTYKVDANPKDDYIFNFRHGENQMSAEYKGLMKVSFGHSKTRVKNNNGFDVVDIVETYGSYVKTLGSMTNVAPVYNDFIKMLNTKIANPNDNTKTITTAQWLKSNFPGSKANNPYDRLVDYAERTVGFKLNGFTESTALDKIISGAANLKIGGTLAGFAVLKQPASAFTANVSMTSLAKGTYARITGKNDAEWMKENLPGVRFRGVSNAAVLGNMVGDNPFNKYTNFLNKYVMAPLRKNDSLTIDLISSYALPAQVEAYFGFRVGSPENRELVKQLWTDARMKQIGNDPAHTTKLSRSKGVTRLFFGNYQGAINAFISGFKDKIYSAIKYWNVKEEDVTNRLTTSIEKSNKAREVYERADKELKEAQKRLVEAEKNKDKEEINTAKEDLKKAQTNYEERLSDFQDKEAEHQAAENDKREWNRWKNYGGGDKFKSKAKFGANLVGGTLAMAITLSLVDQIKKWVTAQEKPKDFDMGAFMTTVMTNASVNQIPIINTLYNSLVSNYDIENPGLSIVTDTVNFFAKFKDYISKGSWDKMVRDGAWLMAGTSGLPLKTAYQIISGITSYFSPETAIKMRNVMYNVSSTANVKSFHQAAESGRDKEASAYLKVVMQDKVGATTDKVTEELYRLYQKGENSVPKASMTSYTNEKGEEVTLTDLQKTNFRNTYSKANNLVDKLIKNSYYTSLSDEQKGNAISYVYNAYYDYAKGNVTNTYSSKMGYVLGKTKGNVDTNTVATSISYIKGLEATKKSTRKELAIKYVNSLKCEKGLKYLILKLAGYGLDDKAKSTLKRYLTKQGMSGKDAKEFVE